MKMSKEWEKLTRDQKAAWCEWAANNAMALDASVERKVSGIKAFTLVERNRGLAGVALAPTVQPAAVTWLVSPLSTRDAGPYTENGGFVGFRAEVNIPNNTKFFVWATPPAAGTIAEVRGQMRFVGVMTVSPALTADDVSPNLVSWYENVCGPLDGPGEGGAWPVSTYVYFRVHEYKNGQLGPGFGIKTGAVRVEL